MSTVLNSTKKERKQLFKNYHLCFTNYVDQSLFLRLLSKKKHPFI